MASLEQVLNEHTAPGLLYEQLPGDAVRCVACGHRCLIREGRRGVCRVRFNRNGTLYVPHGYVGALQCEPIEKKPFFHALPGARALSFGMLGCSYHCGYCHNWMTSQTLRDPAADVLPEAITPETIIRLARQVSAQALVSTYNEPLITSEWAVDIFKIAKAEGFVTAYVSNGEATPEVLEYLRPHLDLYKVDLKSFDENHYRAQLGGQLSTVLDTIRQLYAMESWLEIVTLVIPGFNDTDDELRRIADFIVSVSPDIPWHVTAFRRDYKMTDRDDTPPEMLIRACEIGERAGLHYIYAGNLPGLVQERENTYCPSCQELLVERRGYTILRNLLNEDCCPSCQTKIPGSWSKTVHLQQGTLGRGSALARRPGE